MDLARVTACVGVLLVASVALVPHVDTAVECGRPPQASINRPRPSFPSPSRPRQSRPSPSRPSPSSSHTVRSPRQAGSPTSRRPFGPPPPPAVHYASCGAIPISDRLLVTAAFCVIDPNRPIYSVRLGDLDLAVDGEPNSRPADYDIEEIYVHPNFRYRPGSKVRYSDLALLKTVQPIQFNDVVFPYCVSSSRPAAGTTVIASGFGYVNATHQPTHLREGELKVMPLRECEAQYTGQGKRHLLREAYPELLQGKGVLCAGYPGRGACKGDEGGPLFREDSEGRRFLEGIISFTGDTCDHTILPGVFTSMADHLPFLNEALNSN